MVLGCLGITEKDEVTAIRKKIRPTVGFLCRIKFCRQGRSATLRGYSQKPVRPAKKYHSVATPRAAPVFNHVTKCLSAAARRANPKILPRATVCLQRCWRGTRLANHQAKL